MIKSVFEIEFITGIISIGIREFSCKRKPSTLAVRIDEIKIPAYERIILRIRPCVTHQYENAGSNQTRHRGDQAHGARLHRVTTQPQSIGHGRSDSPSPG